LVAALGLGDLIDRRVGTYSGGQRRRLEIARALVSAPEVLFLDEPTVGLDLRIRHELLDVIAALRERGAQRELLAAPIPRALLVAGNVLVVLGLCALQVGVLLGVALLRGAEFHAGASGVAWFAAAAVLFTVLMYGVAELPASRMPDQEEYIAATPVVAILPRFFAGALFPIAALPAALTAFAKALPLTHALALMRYGLVDPHATGLHDIWGTGNATAEAMLSLAVVAAWALVVGVLAVRAFTRSAVR
jgi:ABC-type multidrug transport system permease subunit